MEYSIIIPIFNEDEKVDILLNELENFKKEFEIIIIDDGSTDGTSEKLSAYEEIIFTRNKLNLGKSASIIKGLDLANGKYVVLFDGDLEISTNEIKKLFKIHKKNKHCIVKGNRNLKSNKISVFGLGGYILNYFFNFINKSSFKDIFCCLIIIEKRLLKSFNIQSKKFGIETEIMTNIVKSKLRYIEKKIEYKRRKFKKGKKFNIFDVYEILKIMVLKKIR